jgi:enamine deaminase RidA (YjgF/YER057c/UK114 family)
VSGFTSEADRLEEQVVAIVRDIDNVLQAASTSWKRVVKISVYLSRSQNIDVVKNLLDKTNRLDVDKTEFELVDGFARNKGLVEIEPTALIGQND